MKINKKLFCLAAIPFCANAGWPTFNVLTLEQVLQQVVTADCKKGEARIPPGTKIRIKATNIPSDQTWYWEYTGTSQCQKMPLIEKPIKYLVYEQTGRSAGNSITTVYGDTLNGEPLFSFSFIIPSEPPGWDCGPSVSLKPPTTIGCARDM